jgi:phosphomannomutase
MLKQDLLRLQSGSDVRGIASEGITGQDITLTDEAVTLICKAFVTWLAKKINKQDLRIAVGNDSRISAERIFTCVQNAFTACGADVIYTGLCSTPSLFMLLQKPAWGCDASVMITASHLPFNRNGLKFFLPSGGLESSDIAEVLALAAEESFIKASKKGTLTQKSFMDEYSADLVLKVRNTCGSITPLAGKKIVVDAGNGAGGFFVEKVLKPLGADTQGSRYLEPNGMFPNHIPNPEDRAAITALKEAVLTSHADLGVIFDTDVDRAGAVDSDGKEINRNKLIALISAILLKEKCGTIVTDSVTSDGLHQFIESLGGKHVRFKRGYKNVINKCIELNNSGEYSPLAIETSGHAALAENYFLDDGAYLITRILCYLGCGGNIGSLLSGLEEPKEEIEIRLNFVDKDDFKAKGQGVIEALCRKAQNSKTFSLAPQNYEGARLCFAEKNGDGWALIRMSVHDPLMPINIESNQIGGTKKIALQLKELLKEYAFLDLSPLKAFLEQ